MSDNAYEAEITLAFDYKADKNSSPERHKIESERISYIMIEEIYENERILPVIYVSANISSEIYTLITNGRDTSEFYLKIRKRNALSDTSAFTVMVEDTFSYVTPNTSANYGDTLNTTDAAQDSAYRNTMIGLVSSTMTNNLRQSYNGVYNNITVENIIKELALKDLKNVIMQDIKYDKEFSSILFPPLSSRYKLLDFLFNKYAFYDSYFTFFMDFKNTYLIPRNAEAVSAKDGKPDNVMIEIKNYDSKDAYTDGFEISNGAYLVYVNANDTNITINTSTDKVSNNIVGYSDQTGVQNLSVTTNPNEKNSEKKTYIRSNSAAAIKNDLQSNAVMIQLLKQNLDPEMFTPNKRYDVKHYSDYNNYDGKYYLAYKRTFFSIKNNNLFIINCNVGLKQAVIEETARVEEDSYSPSIIRKYKSSKKTSTANKLTGRSSIVANRALNQKTNSGTVQNRLLVNKNKSTSR